MDILEKQQGGPCGWNKDLTWAFTPGEMECTGARGVLGSTDRLAHAPDMAISTMPSLLFFPKILSCDKIHVTWNVPSIIIFFKVYFSLTVDIQY